MRPDQRPNNFDFIRIAAASMVLASHQWALMGGSEPWPFGLTTLGTLGVLIFFSLSGYLVAQSWDRDPHVWRFGAKRFLRIWPGLVVVTVVAALLVGPLCSSLPLHEYFRSPATWTYFKQMYLDTDAGHFLPNVFAHNVWPVVNGSLWTIPVEVRWYGIVLVVGACGLLRPRLRYAMLAAVVGYAIYIYAVFDVQHNPLARFGGPHFGIEYGTYFCYGAALHYTRDAWSRNLLATGAGLAVLALVLIALRQGFAAQFVLLPFIVVAVGSASWPVVRRFGRFGDFSYGIYIYAFLVQQTVMSIIGLQHSYAWLLGVSSVFTLACAVVSWYCVERPALGLKRHLGTRGEAPPGPVPGLRIGTAASAEELA